MMEQAGVFRASVCAVAVSVVTTVCAQDNAQPAAAEQQPAAAVQQPAAEQAPAAEQQPAAEQTPAAEQQPPVKFYDLLVRMMNVHGACEVKNPDVGQFAPAQNGKAYPLGAAVRTGAGGTVTLAFSSQESVQVLENSEVLVGSPAKDAKARFVQLLSGKIKTNLRDNLPEGSFCVETPNASCKNLAGRGDFSLNADAAVETFQAATITGMARVEGPQYAIPALRAANTVNIQTATNRTLSRLTSVSGDFPIVLENGTETPVNFGMSPKAVVKIWRENAPVGGRPIISTLVVSPTGMARHRFAYADGRPNLATGELIAPPENEEEKENLPVLLKKEEAKPPAPAEEAKPEKDAAAAAQ